MESLHKELSGFAAYFGIVAAILALGSWLTTNYFGNKANSARDALKEAKAAFENSSRFRRLYGLVNEETQNLDHVYDLVRSLNRRLEGDMEGRPDRQAERYDRLKRLEYARHGDRVVQDELERAGQLVEYAAVLNTDKEVVVRAAAINDKLLKIIQKRQSAREELEFSVKQSGDIYQLEDEQWDLLLKEFERYRRIVEIDLIPAQNGASRDLADLELKIVRLQTCEAGSRRNVARVVQRIALMLYIASALLAVYGKWLEAKYPKPKNTEPGAAIAGPVSG